MTGQCGWTGLGIHFPGRICWFYDTTTASASVISCGPTASPASVKVLRANRISRRDAAAVFSVGQHTYFHVANHLPKQSAVAKKHVRPISGPACCSSSFIVSYSVCCLMLCSSTVHRCFPSLRTLHGNVITHPMQQIFYIK